MADASPEPERRRRILDAAVRVFAERGHDGTRIHDVAAEAGVAYGLVYHYFGTKDRLLATVFDENWAIFAEVVEGITTSERPPDDQLRAVLDYALGAFEAYPDRMKVILLEYGRLARLGTALQHPDVRRVIAALTRSFAEARARGLLVDGASPEVLPLLLLGALQAACAGSLTDGAVTTRAVRETVTALFRGLFRSPRG